VNPDDYPVIVADYQQRLADETYKNSVLSATAKRKDAEMQTVQQAYAALYDEHEALKTKMLSQTGPEQDGLPIGA
jgi:hypothetical protein